MKSMQNPTDTDDKECQYTCLYNIRTTRLLSFSLVSYGMNCLSWGLDLRLSCDFVFLGGRGVKMWCVKMWFGFERIYLNKSSSSMSIMVEKLARSGAQKSCHMLHIIKAAKCCLLSVEVYPTIHSVLPQFQKCIAVNSWSLTTWPAVVLS